MISRCVEVSFLSDDRSPLNTAKNHQINRHILIKSIRNGNVAVMVVSQLTSLLSLRLRSRGFAADGVAVPAPTTLNEDESAEGDEVSLPCGTAPTDWTNARKTAAKVTISAAEVRSSRFFIKGLLTFETT